MRSLFNRDFHRNMLGPRPKCAARRTADHAPGSEPRPEQDRFEAARRWLHRWTRRRHKRAHPASQSPQQVEAERNSLASAWGKAANRIQAQPLSAEASDAGSLRSLRCIRESLRLDCRRLIGCLLAELQRPQHQQTSAEHSAHVWLPGPASLHPRSPARRRGPVSTWAIPPCPSP
jgi:hypothetical protein